MSYEPKEWTLEGFVDYFAFVHEKMGDHKFAWVLGAGASIDSGIPLGGTLVDRWLQMIYNEECNDKENTPIERWATRDSLGRQAFKNFTWKDRSAFYSQIFERCFSDHADKGYAFLEDVMAGKEPSPGYSILAKALAESPPRHNVVITTNFDNLVADALSIYTDVFPLICGHESLAGYARVALRRPLICKIHRDLLFSPQNDRQSLRRLHDAWGNALTALFQHYTPLFIGYGGNDDTLMDLLEWLKPGSIKGQMIWCYHENDPLPRRDDETAERIRRVVTQHNGRLVRVPTFDLLMILVGEKMTIELLDQEIENRSDRRVEQYRERVKSLDILKYDTVKNAFAAMARRSGGWWSWEQVARAEKNPDRKEMIYREALNHYPNSFELHCNFANFLWQVRVKHDEAESLYNKALELDPNNVDITGNYAGFLEHVRGKHDESETLYEKALELDPNNTINTGNYANFLWQVRGKHDEAEALYRKALELDPNDAINTGNYTEFLICRGRSEEAAEMLTRAKSLNKGAVNYLAAGFAWMNSLLVYGNGEDDTAAIKELNNLFTTGFARSPWSFDHVLAFARDKMPDEDYELYVKLTNGILDSSKVPDVEALLAGRGKQIPGAATAKAEKAKSRRKRVMKSKTKASN